MTAIRSGRAVGLRGTDLFRPLVELGEELSGRRYDGTSRRRGPSGSSPTTVARPRSCWPTAVVPSNEERGYILRRIMQRTMQQGRTLGLADPFLPTLYDRAIELMGGAYPELEKERETIERWARAEEERFGRTLAQGERLLADLIAQAKQDGTSWIDAEDAFRLHDTYGFPYEMTKELWPDGLSVDDQGFEELMEKAREVSRGGVARGPAEDTHKRVIEDARRRLRVALASATRRRRRRRSWAPSRRTDACSPSFGIHRRAAAESPTRDRRDAGQQGEVIDVYRLGNDQALALAPLDEIGPGQEVRAMVERAARLATMRNHTATHLLHAALHPAAGHVRQAGSYVGPDKLRFDFAHGERLGPDELRDVEEHREHHRIADSHPVRAIETTGKEAEALGDGAVRREVRRLGAHGRGWTSPASSAAARTATTAEVGIFEVTTETSNYLERAPNRGSHQAGGRRAVRGAQRPASEEIAAMLRVPGTRWSARSSGS